MTLAHRILTTICLALAAGACAAQGTAYVSSEKDDALTLIDTKTLAVKGTIPTCKRGRHIQRRPDGKLMVACTDSNAADVIDPATGKSVRRVPLGEFVPSYLSFSVTDPAVASVSSLGRLQSLTQGTTILVAASHGVQAATAVTVGLPQDPLGLSLYLKGLNACIPAPSRWPAMAVRGFKVYARSDLTLTNELTSSAAGTHYFVRRPGVVDVSADGLATAQAQGTATVTVVEVTGTGRGTHAQAYVAGTAWQFDFNKDASSPTAGGHVAVLPAANYGR